MWIVDDMRSSLLLIISTFVSSFHTSYTMSIYIRVAIMPDGENGQSEKSRLSSEKSDVIE